MPPAGFRGLISKPCARRQFACSCELLNVWTEAAAPAAGDTDSRGVKLLRIDAGDAKRGIHNAHECAQARVESSLTLTRLELTSSVHHSGGQWHAPPSHSPSTWARAESASGAITCIASVPTRTVCTVTENSGTSRSTMICGNNPGLLLAATGARQRRNFDNTAFAAIRAH